ANPGPDRVEVEQRGFAHGLRPPASGDTISPHTRPLDPQTDPEMNSEILTRFLTQSLADRKLSGGEKSALADWLVKNVTTDQHRGLVRHTAFEVARALTTDPAAADLIEWLEDVMKVI